MFSLFNQMVIAFIAYVISLLVKEVLYFIVGALCLHFKIYLHTSIIICSFHFYSIGGWKIYWMDLQIESLSLASL